MCRAEGASIDVVLTEIEACAQADLFNRPEFVREALGWITRHGGTEVPEGHSLK